MEQAIVQIARRIRDGLFLLEGGAEFFTYFEGQESSAGSNRGQPRGARRAAARGNDLDSVSPTGGKVVARQAWPVTLKQGESATREFRMPPPAQWPHEGFHRHDRVEREAERSSTGCSTRLPSGNLPLDRTG